MKRIYFKNLDGLRFLCFLAVFFYHSFHTEVTSIKDSSIYLFLTKTLFTNGNLGVNFFFVLSGFLITYLLIIEKKSNNQINLKNFWMRRVLRIWPLFYFCLLFGFFAFPFIKSLFGQSSAETANLSYYLLFANNFDIIKNGLPDASVLGVLWSIAIEEQFYLVWPILLYFFPVKQYWIVFSSVILVSLVFRGFNTGYYNYEFHTLSCIGDMTVGSFGAWLILEGKSLKQRFVDLKKIEIIVIYSLLALVFLFRKNIFRFNEAFYIFERILIAILFLFGI